MIDTRSLSLRALSEEIEVPLSTLRFHLDYPKALDARKLCARDDCEAEISQLSHEQIVTYPRLPAEWRDRWLDAGRHSLLLTAGGSAGQSGCWHLDVREGVVGDDFAGRKWQVKVRDADEVLKQLQSAAKTNSYTEK